MLSFVASFVSIEIIMWFFSFILFYRIGRFTSVELWVKPRSKPHVVVWYNLCSVLLDTVCSCVRKDVYAYGHRVCRVFVISYL